MLNARKPVSIPIDEPPLVAISFVTQEKTSCSAISMQFRKMVGVLQRMSEEDLLEENLELGHKIKI